MPFRPTLINGPWERLKACLLWQYGGDKAMAILDGEEEATEDDKRAWRALGRPKPDFE